MLDQGKLVAEGTPQELKRLVRGGHIRLQFTDTSALEKAARALGDAAPGTAGAAAMSCDNEALTLQVPSDGGVGSLRALLDRLDEGSIEVDELSVHTPDLDDVFLAITGRQDGERKGIR